MGRKIDVGDLVSALEIAERLHLNSLGLVSTWHHRYTDSPQPVAKAVRRRTRPPGARLRRHKQGSGR